MHHREDVLNEILVTIYLFCVKATFGREIQSFKFLKPACFLLHFFLINQQLVLGFKFFQWNIEGVFRNLENCPTTVLYHPLMSKNNFSGSLPSSSMVYNWCKLFSKKKQCIQCICIFGYSMSHKRMEFVNDIDCQNCNFLEYIQGVLSLRVQYRENVLGKYIHT